MSNKPASRANEDAMHANDAHNPTIASKDAVPGIDAEHAHSHAAHLHDDAGFKANLPKQGNLAADTRQDLREPPQEPSRNGKGRK
jgi:hypothetical protein